MDDVKLVQLLKQKKDEALEALVDKYSAYVSTVIRNVVGGMLGESDVEEMTADVFISVWKNTGKLVGDTLRAYLAVSARNISIDRLRRLHYTVPIDELEIDDCSDVESATDQKLIAEEFNSVMAELPERDRELLLRFYFYYQKIPQIAAEMNISESSCKTGLHRARNKLKEKMIERGYGYEKESI
jgi:RNA polymerase sigma-70 factor (ECF subfamily)